MKKQQYINNEYLLEMNNIHKSFGSVEVLKGVDFGLKGGEVHVLAGENGAGKSTLMKILCGIHTADQGVIKRNGEIVNFKKVADSARHGISMIHQELSMIKELSIVDNIFLGQEITRFKFFNNPKEQEKKTTAILNKLNINIDCRRKVEEFAVSTQQMFEIAKALTFDAQIIIMDEPTSALNKPEAERLFDLIAELKSAGHAIVYISHKMDEIYRLADKITVLRDGEFIISSAASELPENKLVAALVGRELNQQYPNRTTKVGSDFFTVKNYSVEKKYGHGKLVDNISFSLKKGEILGIAGLEGSGNHELFYSLFGAYGINNSGNVVMDGRKLKIKNPKNSIEHNNMMLLTHDRKGDGLILDMSIQENTSLASMKRFSNKLTFMNKQKERKTAELFQNKMNIKCSSVNQCVGELSGGNQQKVVLAKCLETNPQVLLLDEPTRGVDVGAKKEIYDLMNQCTDAGISIILITSEMSELLAMSDRILVMHLGEITRELAKNEATPENVLAAAMGKVI
ncbi:sugar ABC transporter ATP-binding protein [Lentisphaerota bacterium WC36G]|nr:sugar ABC transporter ATP-binding protein [Lentisphaerae bacterium WC36]